MSKGKAAVNAYTFTRAAHDELLEVERAYGLCWRLEVVATNQRGVFEYHLSLRRLEASPESRPPIRYSHTWPNAEDTTFEAFLYQVAHRACRMADSWAESGREHQAKGR